MKMGTVLAHMWSEILPKKRVAVFVDGCFWHECPIHSSPAKWLKKSSMTDASPSPKRRLSSTVAKAMADKGRTGKEFWAKKMAGNIARDRFVNRQLRKAGWRVVRIWEHELRNPVRVVALISKALHG